MREAEGICEREDVLDLVDTQAAGIAALEGKNWNYKTALERISFGEQGVIPTKQIAINALHRKGE